MRNSIRLAAVAAVLAASAFGSAAQAATTAQGTATAEILTTLTVTSARNLAFGQIAVNGAGTVAISAANGNLTCSALLVCTGTNSSGSFNVTGTAGTAFVATVTSASATLTSGANSMTVDGFAVAYPSGNSLTAGSGSFDVGGTLHVGAAQAAGVYSGNFNVSVEYQ